MAKTDFGALTDANKKVWAGKIWETFRDQSFFMANGFVGANAEDSNRPIHRVTELTETDRGTECIMQIVLDLTGDGVAGDDKLEDNEEALYNDAVSIKLDQIRNGVKSKGYQLSPAF